MESFGPPASPPHAMGCRGGRALLVCPHHHVWEKVAGKTCGDLGCFLQPVDGESWVVAGACWMHQAMGVGTGILAAVGAAEGGMPSPVALGETSLSASIFCLQTGEDLRKALKTYALW